MAVDVGHGREALYFHGSLLEYLDIKRRQDFEHEMANFSQMNIQAFFDGELAQNVSFDTDAPQYTIPSFMPPVSIKPVMTQKNIETWYMSNQRLWEAEKIIIIGYSFNSSDEHFNGMLKTCREKSFVIVDVNVESVKRMLRAIFGVLPEDYHCQQIQGHDAYIYDNITIIKSKANEIDYTQL